MQRHSAPPLDDAPTLDDARLAAGVLLDAGVAEVWLFGSVARGESNSGSDIDLVALFDDLEYRQRYATKDRLQKAARAVCGRPVDVLVTDRPEWRIQREHVSSSFASAISCDLKLLACGSEEPADVNWDKEQVMSTSNEELSMERMRGVLLNVTKIDTCLTPSRSEQDLAEQDDPGDYLLVRGGRLVMLCEAADMAVENAAKAVAVLSDVKPKTLWEHDVGKIVSALDEEDTSAFKKLLDMEPGLVKSTDYVSMWRTRGVYGTPTEGMTAQEVATPAFAGAIGLNACEVTSYAADTVERRVGEHHDSAEARRWAARIRDGINHYDLDTGDPRSD